MLKLTTITPAATQPVTLDMVKTMLQVAHSDEDALITHYISAATQQVEQYLQKALIRRTYQYRADSMTNQNRLLTVPKDPIISITSLTIQTSVSVTVSISPSNLSTLGNKIYPTDWKSLPAPFSPLGCITLIYQAGYGDTSSTIPTDIIQAILLHIADAYQQRLPTLDRTPFTQKVQSLLLPYRVMRL